MWPFFMRASVPFKMHNHTLSVSSIVSKAWVKTLVLLLLWCVCLCAGQGMKTVIPKTASAKISLRLVPDMTPEYVTAKVKEHLEASAPPHTNVTVQVLGFKANPWVR
jgi:acetylornithine deacetylase/succinyl-diaminopimelate desuccinylase-like protein